MVLRQPLLCHPEQLLRRDAIMRPYPGHLKPLGPARVSLSGAAQPAQSFFRSRRLRPINYSAAAFFT
jgi:hypothetical protein